MNASASLFSKKNLLPWLLIIGGALVAFMKPITGKIFPAELETKIQPAPAIMPAVYKVYENEDALEGKYSLFKMSLKNTSDHVANDVEVSYEIPGLVENTVCQKIFKILPGQTVVVNCYPHFPQSIVERTTSSREKVNIMVKGANIKNIENSFSVPMKGRNEFVYTFIPSDEIRTAAETFDNRPLLACFVTPEDPIIKYLTQKIQEKLLKGEAASVENKEAEGVRVMLGVYEATLRSHMVYSGTSGVPEKIGDASTITQSLRLPREVITGKTGLCIELSLLYASVLMGAGMDPIVYLVPGHAYPGFRMNGKYYAIESTAIGGEGLGGRSSGQQALQAGMKNLETFMQHAQMEDPGYMVLDVREAIKEGAVAMELKDDNFLRQKIDEIAQSFDAGAVATKVNTGGGVNPNNNSGGGNGGGENDGGNGGGNAGIPSGYKAYNGVLSFAYPASWRKLPQNGPMPSSLVTMYGNSSGTMDVQVYSFPGFSSAEQAMNSLANEIRNIGAQYGMDIQYQNSGSSDGFTVFRGMTGNQNRAVNWVGAFRSTGNGVAGITITLGQTNNVGPTATKILNTLR